MEGLLSTGPTLSSFFHFHLFSLTWPSGKVGKSGKSGKSEKSGKSRKLGKLVNLGFLSIGANIGRRGESQCLPYAARGGEGQQIAMSPFINASVKNIGATIRID